MKLPCCSLLVLPVLFVVPRGPQKHTFRRPTQTMGAGPWLRIIQINDVYELDNFPSLKTLIDTHKEEETINNERRQPDKTLVICAGDFLAPSLLSSLDQGASMVDCLNAVGVTHVCLGNHEADVVPADTALKVRMLQSNFVWINSNPIKSMII